MASSKLQALWNHPAGPKTIHFWAPTFKWGITLANVADFTKPPEKLSYPQQIAVTCTGIIWSRYSLVVKPRMPLALMVGAMIPLNDPLNFVSKIYHKKNWNLFSVNVAMAGTGLYQLSRKLRHDQSPESQEVVA